MAIGAVVGGIAQGLGSAAAGGQGTTDTSYAGGLGNKLLGAPGDPAGNILNLILGRKKRNEAARQFDAELGIQKDQLLLEQQKAAIQKMLDMQTYKGNDQKLQWMNDFKKSMARGY